MPILKPHDNETRSDFVARCMGNEMMTDEYPESGQRAAVCYGAWRSRNKGGTMERKAISIELKLDKPGLFTARIAKLNEVDLDTDITLPGAFPDGKAVLVSAYQHGSWNGALPIGKAVIREVGEEVLSDGEFNLNTTSGKEHYEAIKFAGQLQEWSYGFQVIDSEPGEKDGKAVRYLKKVDPYEISPVLKGAGKETATLSIKQQKAGNIQSMIESYDSWAGSFTGCMSALSGKPGITDPEALCAWMHHEATGEWPAEKEKGLTYISQLETVLAAVRDFGIRTKSLADLRRTEGRKMSQSNLDRMHSLMESMREMMTDMEDMLADESKALETLFLEYAKTKKKTMEVLS